MGDRVRGRERVRKRRRERRRGKKTVIEAKGRFLQFLKGRLKHLRRKSARERVTM